MDQRDLKILSVLENGLPLVTEPFGEIGKQLGMTSEEVLDRVKYLRMPVLSADSVPVLTRGSSE